MTPESAEGAVIAVRSATLSRPVLLGQWLLQRPGDNMHTWATEVETLSNQYQAAIRLWHYSTTLEERMTATEKTKDSLMRLVAFFDEYYANDSPSHDREVPF